MPFFQGFSPIRQIRTDLELAIDLDGRWRKVAGDLLIDVVAARLEAMARNGQSLLGLGDDVLASLDPRYQTEGADDALGGGLGVVLGRPDLGRNLDSIESLQGMMSVVLGAAAEAKNPRHPYTPGLWAEVVALAAELDREVWQRRARRFQEIELAFHGTGLHASALLVHRVWRGALGDSVNAVYASGLQSLKPQVESLRKDALRARRLAVALGYWGEVHQPDLPAAALAADSAMAGLLARLANSGGFSDALTVAVHLGMDHAVVSVPVYVDPWKDNPLAQEIMQKLDSRVNPKEIERQLRPSADAGQPEALFLLAILHRHGLPGEGALARARNYYELAAQAGLPEASNELGGWHESGVDGSKDSHLAFDNYRRAADAGLLEGLCNLARLHFFGVEGRRNQPVAIALYRHAASLGSAVALNSLGTLYGQGVWVPQSSQQAFDFFSAAAEKSDPIAHYNLGLCYWQGIGVEPDLRRAFVEMQKAAEAGHAPAASHLACFHQQGVGTPTDAVKAWDWMQQAERLGSPEARRIIDEGRQQQQQALAELTRRPMVTPRNNLAHRPELGSSPGRFDMPQQAARSTVDQATLDYELGKVRAHFNRLRAQPGADLSRINSAERVAIQATIQKVLRQPNLGGQ